MFDALFIDSEVENLFKDEAVARAMLRFEAGLALAQADANIISSDGREFDRARVRER